MADLDDVVEALNVLTGHLSDLKRIQLENLRQNSPPMHPKTYRITVDQFNEFRLLADLQSDTKFFSITNNSEVDVEIDWTGRLESGQQNVLFSREHRVFNMTVPHVYARLNEGAPFGSEALLVIRQYTYRDVSSLVPGGIPELPSDAKNRSKRKPGTDYTTGGGPVDVQEAEPTERKLRSTRRTRQTRRSARQTQE